MFRSTGMTEYKSSPRYNISNSFASFYKKEYYFFRLELSTGKVTTRIVVLRHGAPGLIQNMFALFR